MKNLLMSVVLICFAASALAHDFWLGSSSWHVAPGSKVTVTANVGNRFPTADSYTAPDRVASFHLVGPAGTEPVPMAFRREQDSLAAEVQLPAQPGTYMAVMTIRPRFIEIKAQDFTTYLTHEGLEGVIKERERRGEHVKLGRERYARYAKLLIRAGDGGAGHVTKPVGLKAELVPQSDPTRLHVGDRLTAQLLVDGGAVQGALIAAVYAGSTGAPDDWPLKSRTDADGRVTFRLTEPGPWLIRSVHMVRREGETGAEASDWESYWASLTFDLIRR